MPEPLPFFTIVVPTFNRAHRISKTINSALQQTFSDFEILVIDDGSTDNTKEVVNSFDDNRMHYHLRENNERGAARNFGASKARGKYINFFDSDDLMYPNHLTIARQFISRVEDPEVFHLGYDYKLDDGTVTDLINNFDESIARSVLFDNKFSCNGMFVRADIARQFPFEEDRIMASSEDWELWIRLLSRFKFHFSNEVTSSVVNHDQRSLLTIAPDKIVARDLFFMNKIQQDKTVMRNYGPDFKKFVAERYTFFMLSFSEQHKLGKVFRWGILALRSYPTIGLSKRFLASLRNVILRW